MEYISFLKKIDSKITDSSKENLKDSIDFLKIEEGKYGVINLNNMFPVPNNSIVEFDVKNEIDKKYKKILENQLSWCNKIENKQKILKRAKKLHKLIIGNKLDKVVVKRCCNFKLLEEKVIEWEKIKENKILKSPIPKKKEDKVNERE